MWPFKRSIRIEAKLDSILSLLQTLITKGTVMAKEIDDLIARVKVNTDTEASAVILIQGMAAQISALVNQTPSLSADDKAKLLKAISDLDASAAPLSAAVVANTPAAKP